MPLTLTLKSDSRLPIEVDGINPANLRGLSHVEICRLPIFHGNRKIELGDMFELTGTEDGCLRFVGDLRSVHWIGAKMDEGEIKIVGDVGRHVGSQMVGGAIDVSGDAGDFSGCEMTGGSIRIRGNASDWLGGGYPGTNAAMNGGRIMVDGDAGDGVGSAMRRGMIGVMGDVGKLVGWNMRAGTIFVGGKWGADPGTGMVRGTIILNGNSEASDLPVTFGRSGGFEPVFLPVLLKQHGISLGDVHTTYDLYCGDVLKGGRGEIFLATGTVQSSSKPTIGEPSSRR